MGEGLERSETDCRGCEVLVGLWSLPERVCSVGRGCFPGTQVTEKPLDKRWGLSSSPWAGSSGPGCLFPLDLPREGSSGFLLEGLPVSRSTPQRPVYPMPRTTQAFGEVLGHWGTDGEQTRGASAQPPVSMRGLSGESGQRRLLRLCRVLRTHALTPSAGRVRGRVPDPAHA